MLCLEAGLLDEEQLDRARRETGPEVDDSALLAYLLKAALLNEDRIVGVVADSLGLETADLTLETPEPEALQLLSRELAERYGVLPLRAEPGSLELVVADPFDMGAVDDLGHLFGRMLHIRVAGPSRIREAISLHYNGGAEVAAEGSSVNAAADAAGSGALELVGAANGEVAAEEAPIIRYVEKIIAEALRRRASDIHLEPLEKRFRIRYRVDGVLQEVENPPKRLQPSIISRIKIMSHISIAEKRVPQDGRISARLGSRALDLRVSTLPTAFGESVVMRILDKEGLRLGLPNLGFFSDDQTVFERLISQPDGIFLVTGPTGSGKSTTLYSALNYINQPDRKIITVEDPVEYEMAGINQVQVRPDVGMTFAAALRSMLRQAPNIIMVGEIRDRETAEIALNASLTGHMVYSTLHTNDAPGAISRLIDIGIQPFLISASLRGVLAQRLVRQIDPDHCEPYTPTEAELKILGMERGIPPEADFRQGVPHPENAGTGFRGRKGIFELLEVDEGMENLIYENASLVELRRRAREGGMRTMREDGLRKVVAGITTLAEVLNVTVESSDL